MVENREDMKPEEKGKGSATDKPDAPSKPKDEMSKTQEDAAKERTKGGYQ